MSAIMKDCLDDRYTRFSATQLDESALEIAQREIGESVEIRENCLRAIKVKLKEELEDVQPCLEDEFLLRYLRVAKFNIEKAFCRIKRFYELMDVQLKKFKNCSLTVSTVRRFPYLKASPYRMKDNSILVFSKFATVDPSYISFEEKLYEELIVYSHLVSNPITQMCGVTLVVDFTGFNFRILLCNTPAKQKLFYDSAQNSFPVRVRRIHVVNTPHIFKVAYDLTYSFLPKKLQNRLIIHPKDDWKSLHATVPAEILPQEYGGQLKNIELVDLLENLQQLDSDYRKYLKYGLIKTRFQREKLRMFTDF